MKMRFSSAAHFISLIFNMTFGFARAKNSRRRKSARSEKFVLRRDLQLHVWKMMQIREKDSEWKRDVREPRWSSFKIVKTLSILGKCFTIFLPSPIRLGKHWKQNDKHEGGEEKERLEEKLWMTQHKKWILFIQSFSPPRRVIWLKIFMGRWFIIHRTAWRH